MKVTNYKSFVLIVLLISGIHPFVWAQKSKPPVLGPSQKSASPTGATLDLVLEGPFALCTSVPNNPNKFKVLVPSVGNHFNPGFDSDFTEFPLCGGDYSLDIVGHSGGSGKPPKQGPNGEIFDTANMACPPASDRFLSLLVDSPDQDISIASSTYATVTGSGVKGKQLYVTRMVLSYQGVDLTKIQVSRVSGDNCKFPTGVGTPFKFMQSATEGHLVFSMMPSRPDDPDHPDSIDAYAAIAEMLGLQRSVSFDPGNPHSPVVAPQRQQSQKAIPLGSHDDCRAPQILVTQ